MEPTSNSKNSASTTSYGGKSAETTFDEFNRIRANLGIYSPIALLPGSKQLIAVPFQKILIVNTTGEDSSDLLTENKEITIRFTPYLPPSTPIDLLVRVVRVCEYPNPDDEYGIPTNTVLIEWQAINTVSGPDVSFGTFADGKRGITASSQIENLIIQDNPPNNQPGPPVDALADIPLPDGFVVDDSDFNIHPPKGTVDSNAPIVAVLDTGIKTRFRIDGTITNHYPDGKQPTQMRPFRLAPVPANVKHQHGYSPITNYLRASRDSGPTPGLDDVYRTIPTLANIHKLSKAEILNSPYDDHLLTKGQDQNKDVRGRHGTTISAIINQNSTAAILPVKIFNHGGRGTLYDLLCGLNYVLACHQSGHPVRVVNLSFIGQLHMEAYKLLHAKFRALHIAGIWAVAAAGNGHRKLRANVNGNPPNNTNAGEVWNLFPACFAGDPTLSVITVTTVQESSYGVVALHLKKTKLVWSLIGVLLGTVLTLFKSPRKLRLTPVYKTVNNYGKSFVSVGVIEPILKVFENASPHLNTTSFAAAFFSAKLADYLEYNPTADRQEILNKLTFRGEMVSNEEIADNRLIRYE